MENAIETREWWVERWLELLDSYRFKKRLERGRLYAKANKVLQIDFKDSKVLAIVEGTEPEPYKVSLSLNAFSDEDWNYIIETLSQKAIYSAQLLAGEMPSNIEAVFTANGLSLFPFTLSDIHSHCSCADKANPCKHIIAVYYTLADRFSEEPFVLFQLRGKTKSQILEGLRELRSQGKKQQGKTKSKETAKQKKQTSSKKVNSGEINLEQFWTYQEPLESSLVVIVPPPEQKSILDFLGPIPLAAPEAQLVRQYLDQAYEIARQQALMTALKRD